MVVQSKQQFPGRSVTSFTETQLAKQFKTIPYRLFYNEGLWYLLLIGLINK